MTTKGWNGGEKLIFHGVKSSFTRTALMRVHSVHQQFPKTSAALAAEHSLSIGRSGSAEVCKIIEGEGGKPAHPPLCTGKLSNIIG